MIFNVALAPGTTLASVVYRWIAAGVIDGSATGTGITQPWASEPVFRVVTTPPVGAEEIIIYDSTDLTNWTLGGYRTELAAVGAAAQILLVKLYVPTPTVPVQIIPPDVADDSLCRCYGTFGDLGAISVDGIDVLFTLVQEDADDPTIIYDTSGFLIRDHDTKNLISGRVITGKLVAGQLQDSAGNPWLDLVRNDYMDDAAGVALPRLKYILTCPELGAKAGLSSLFTGGPAVFATVSFKLNTASIGQAVGGTFDVSTQPLTQ